MNSSLIILQLNRYTQGWVTYSLYALILIGIFAFIIHKLRNAKKRKNDNDRRGSSTGKTQKE